MTDSTWQALVSAVNAGNEDEARAALWKHLAELPEPDTKMYPHKASRAENLRLVDGVVLFEIERHPGLSELTHKVQAWRVGSGSADLCSETTDWLTRENIIRRTGPPRPRPLGALGAACLCSQAISYAGDFNNESGEEGFDEAAALALAYLAFSRGAVAGRWPVPVAAVANAIGVHYGERADWQKETAREINRAAAALWRSIRDHWKGKTIPQR